MTGHHRHAPASRANSCARIVPNSCGARLTYDVPPGHGAGTSIAVPRAVVLGHVGETQGVPELRLPGMTAARKTPLDAPDAIAEDLRAVAPRFCEAGEHVAAAVGVSMSATHQTLGDRNDVVGEATRSVLTHLANDTIDLIYDLLHGRGRSATRVARSLFEHQIAIELVKDPTMAQRYLDHDAVGRRYFLELDRTERFVTGTNLKAHRFKMRKVDNETSADAGAAVARYGAGFRRGWTPLSIREHATHLGHESDYSFYKVASLPTHGAVAGIFGSRQTVGREVVHRTGPALAACPLPAIYGLSFIQIALQAAEATTGHGALEHWQERVRALISELPSYITATGDIDKELWPEAGPVNAAPMVVVDSYRNAELWIAMPGIGLAYPYDGDYNITKPQKDTYDKLVFDVLPNLSINRLGILLVDAGDIDYRQVRFREQRTVQEVVGLGILGIEPDGTVLAEQGTEVDPVARDLHRRRS